MGRCVSTRFEVFAAEDRFHLLPGEPVTAADVFVHASQSDDCARRPLLDAYGDSREAFMSIDRTLAAATVRGSVEAHGWVTDASVALELDLAWSGSGERDRSAVHERLRGDGSVVVNRLAGSDRAATASGA